MISHSPQETYKFSAHLAKTLQGGDVLGLVGPLGAGKTTLVQGLARALGIKRQITSPTFILLQSYHLPHGSPFRERAIPTLKGSPSKKHVLSRVEGGETQRGCRIKTFVHIDCYRLHDPQQLLDIGISDHFNNPHTLTVIEWADRVKPILPPHTQWIHFSYKYHNTRVITLDKRLVSAYANTKKKKTNPASHRGVYLIGRQVA